MIAFAPPHVPALSRPRTAAPVGHAQPNSLAVVDDRAAGIVQVNACGTWTPAQVSRHFAELAGVLARYRAIGADVRVLVDLRMAETQGEETQDRTGQWLQRVYRPDDKVAIVVGSSLRKAAMRRLPINARRELFLSPEAARNWVLA